MDGIIPINMIGITTNDGLLPYLPTIDEPENNGLQCVTDRPNCCRAGRIGEWYFPNKTRVPILGHGNYRATTFFRNRGDGDGTVNLNRVSNDVMSPIGQFCCIVPDSTSTTQTICANISEFLSKYLIIILKAYTFSCITLYSCRYSYHCEHSS